MKKGAKYNSAEFAAVVAEYKNENVSLKTVTKKYGVPSVITKLILVTEILMSHHKCQLRKKCTKQARFIFIFILVLSELAIVNKILKQALNK
jgi:hypothetical protein